MNFRITYLDAFGTLNQTTIKAGTLNKAWDRARLCWGKQNIVNVKEI